VETIGTLHSINVSNGGVPKRPTTDAMVRAMGIDGDRQRNLEIHGGPMRAVSIYSLELIEALQADGHAIAPGSIGENLTLAGIDWSAMTPGATVEVGEVTLVLTSYTAPCRNIAGSFIDGEFIRVGQKKHPGWSRLYARVVVEGEVRVGDRVRVIAPGSAGTT
jgi:MOSC domain-containing protein YiiM